MQTLHNVIATLKRWGWRIGLSTLAVVLAFWTVQPITEATGVPEVAKILPAVAVLFWLEISLALRRAIFNPRVDFQELVLVAASTADGAAKMAAMFAWGHVVRLGMLLCVIYAL